jgi:uncharacterized protein DUF5658
VGVERVVGQPGMSRKTLDSAVATPVAGAHQLAASLAQDNVGVYHLLLLNISLQLFDGVATYSGLHLGIREGNPLLRNAIHLWGVAPGLLVFKAEACALLWLVYRLAGEELARPALGLLAGVYSVCSLIPWLGTFVLLLVRYS